MWGERISYDRSAEDTDTLRKLTEIVTSLPEPYRATILARYLREQTPSEIAAATNTPLSTVKTRLQRGLVLLRKGLKERDQDWRGLLIGAFALDPRGVSKGSVPMGMPMKLALTAVILIPISLAVRGFLSDSAERPVGGSVDLGRAAVIAQTGSSGNAIDAGNSQATVIPDLESLAFANSQPLVHAEVETPLLRLNLLGPAAFREAFLPTNIGNLIASEEGVALWRPLLAPIEGIWRQWNGDAEFESTRQRVLDYAGRIRLLWMVDPGEGEERDRVSGVLALDRDGSTDLSALSADISRVMQGYLPGEVMEQIVGEYALQTLGVPSGEIVTFPILIDGVMLAFFGEAASLDKTILRCLRVLAIDSGKPAVPMSLQMDLTQLKGLSGMRKEPPLVKAFGLESLRTLHATVRPNGPEAELEVEVQFGNGERGMIEAFFPAVESLPGLLARVPSEATPWFALPFRLDELYRVAVAMAADYNDLRGTDQRMDEELNTRLGLDLGGELLDHLGGEVMLLGDLWQAGDPEVFREGDDPPLGACIAFSLRESGAFSRGFDKLLEHLKGIVNIFETREVNGAKITRLGVMFMTGIHMALDQDLAAVAFGEEGVAQLEALVAKGPSVEAKPLPAPVLGVEYLAPAGWNGLGVANLSALFGGQMTLFFEMLNETLPLEMRFEHSVDETQEMLDKLLPLVEEHELEDLVAMTGYRDQTWRLCLIW